MFIHSEKLNPCKCGSNRAPNLDSDDMIPIWAVNCYDCKQMQRDDNWSYNGAVNIWNRENPIIKNIKL